jgi:phage minor structural protein
VSFLGGETLIKIYNQQLQIIARLENAYNIGFKKSFNEVWTASFSLPLDDPKNDECKPLYYVEVFDGSERIELFRIIPNRKVKNESTYEVTYECEHVLATLMDHRLFRYHQLANITTREVIEYILGGQKTVNWTLGNVEFSRYFQYSFENENLLSALFSVPKPFDVQYEWTYDTTVYPWKLNLVQPEMNVSAEIGYAKNLKGIEREEDPTEIITRIYPLGYGEGVNQLGIETVNPTGLPYIDSDTVNQYGVLEYIWVDRRFQDAATLYNSAKALLEERKNPKVTYAVEGVDLFPITGLSPDKFKCGKVVRIIDPDFGTVELRIVKESKSDVIGAPGNITLDIGSKFEDLGTTQADLERRQQVNELYSQGAVSIDSRDFAENCDPDFPAVIEFPIDEDTVNINKVTLKYKVEAFRGYTRGMKSAGQVVQSVTSSNAGQHVSTATSSSGGGYTNTVTSSSGGGSLQTSDEKLFTTWTAVSSNVKNPTAAFEDHYHETTLQGNWFTHSHGFQIPNHSHNVSLDIPSHSHTVNLNIPGHTHDMSINIPGHTHETEFGIWEAPNKPSNVAVYVDNQLVTGVTSLEGEIDLEPYLSKDSEGRIDRGYHTVSIVPNTIGRIVSTVSLQQFIQSRGNYRK